MTGLNHRSTVLGQNSLLQSNRGTVVLNFGKSAMAGEVQTITVILTRPEYQPIKKSVSAKAVLEQPILRIDGVPAGDWTVTVRAENRSRVSICSGTSSISVEPNIKSIGEISLVPATFSFSWGRERIKWKMHPGNPVLQQSEEGWDSEHYYFDDPTVVKRDGMYHMWYSSAENLRGGETFCIAYATSKDGITWTKHGSVIGPGSGGAWMGKGAICPAVIDDQGLFKMWFVGTNNPSNYHNGIGYASSRDGMTWRIEPEPVVPTSMAGGSTWHPAVLKRESLYYLFTGIANSPVSSPMNICLFTSTDGRNWQSRGNVCSAKTERSWQSSGIAPCEVIYDANRFKMFFTGFEGENFSIGYAESREGMSWSETDNLPLLSFADTAPWATRTVGFPAVMRDEGKLKMWFSALTADPRRYQIGYAEETK